MLRPAVSALQIPNDRSDLHKAALRFRRVSLFCPSENLCHRDTHSSCKLGKWTVRRHIFNRAVAADEWSWRPERTGDSHFERCHLYNVRWRGVKGIISRAAAAEVSRLVSYLLFTSPHYCTLAGAGGSVNIINMAVISPVPRCVEEVRVPGRKMKHHAHHQRLCRRRRRRCCSSCN